MRRSFLILQHILLIFICNLGFVLNDADGHNNNAIPTKILALKNISLSTLSHKSNKLNEKLNIHSDVLEPSVDVELNIDFVKEITRNKNEVTDFFPERSGVSKRIESNGSPLISLSEGASVEFEKFIAISIVPPSETENNKITNAFSEQEDIENVSDHNNNILHDEEYPINELPTFLNKSNNLTHDKNEDIPSFSEWTQKRLEEVEKKEQVNSSSKVQVINGKGSGAKLRWKNYASLDCGAKVIAANPESISPGAILSPSSDEYKLNPCTSRIWFIVELCETIQTKKIDLANYELFSSSPKDFTVSVSDRYPTRDWTIVGTFTAKDERDIQSFDLEAYIFGKYIKVDIKSHYGSEHYCPISLFRAYGTSVFEVLQKEDPAHINRIEDDNEDNNDNGDIGENIIDSSITFSDKENDHTHKNLFSSATDAVILIVKRAAEVLGNKATNDTNKDMTNGMKNYSPAVNTCITPNHMIYCKNCDDTLFGEIYKLISCDILHIQKLIQIPLIYKALSNSVVCQNYDYEYKIISYSSNNLFTDCIASFFPLKYIGAMCNEISILENRGVLNISHPFSNTTGNITNENQVTGQISQTSESELIKLESSNKLQMSETTLVNSYFDTKNAEDYVPDIQPTKPLIVDTKINQTDNLSFTSSVEANQTLEVTSSIQTDTFLSKQLFEHSSDLGSEIDGVSEGIDVIEDHLEHFISELTSNYSQNPSVVQSTTSNSPQAQKESIFLRLSNRIKTLERNMSLSSQYLEELSRRYKKQIEEIQNLLEKTVSSLHEESLQKDLRNKQLEDRLKNLTEVIESLINERHCWFMTSYLLIFSVILISLFYFFCRKHSFTTSKSDTKETAEILSCKPINSIIHNLSEKKKRRPSDQALTILHGSVMNATDENTFSQKQKKKKKKHTLKKSISIANIKDNKCYTHLESKIKSAPDWVERSHQIAEDMPYVLDESDHSTLETYSLENEPLQFQSMDHTSSFLKINVDTSSGCYTNEAMMEISHLDEFPNKEQSNRDLGSVKREKRSFKKFLKKFF